MCWRLLSQKKPLRICDGPFCAVWGCSVLISGTRAAAWVAGTLHSGITVPRGTRNGSLGLFWFHFCLQSEELDTFCLYCSANPY